MSSKLQSLAFPMVPGSWAQGFGFRAKSVGLRDLWFRVSDGFGFCVLRYSILGFSSRFPLFFRLSVGFEL